MKTAQSLTIQGIFRVLCESNIVLNTRDTMEFSGRCDFCLHDVYILGRENKKKQNQKNYTGFDNCSEGNIEELWDG